MNSTQRMERLLNPKARRVIAVVVAAVAAIEILAAGAFMTVGTSWFTPTPNTPATQQAAAIRATSPVVSPMWTPPRPGTSSVYDGQTRPKASIKPVVGGSSAPGMHTGSAFDGRAPRATIGAPGATSAKPEPRPTAVYDGRTSTRP